MGSVARQQSPWTDARKKSTGSAQKRTRVLLLLATVAMLLNWNRPNIRGLRKCPSCGYYNGNRSKACKNQHCAQFVDRGRRHRRLRAASAMLPVRIHTDSGQVQWFSVGGGLVRVEQSALGTHRDPVLVCRTAVCYVDACLQSAGSLAHCRHIEQCSSECVRGTATPVPVLRRQFLKFFSHLSPAERSDLWHFYSTCSSHAVQHLQDGLFVVRARGSCPGDKENAVALGQDFVHCALGQRGTTATFRCSCAPRPHSRCHHLLLLYAAIDGHESLRQRFQGHLEGACRDLALRELDLCEGAEWAPPFLEEVVAEQLLMELQCAEDWDWGQLLEEQLGTAGQRQSVSFDTILTSIIERLNYRATGHQQSVFYVHNDFFSCLSERFPRHAQSHCLSRAPLLDDHAASGGLVTQEYTLHGAETVQRIFTSSSATLSLDRVLPKHHSPLPRGVVQAGDQCWDRTPQWETPETAGEECCVRIAWTADVLPTSAHGELRIAFGHPETVGQWGDTGDCCTDVDNKGM